MKQNIKQTKYEVNNFLNLAFLCVPFRSTSAESRQNRRGGISTTWPTCKMDFQQRWRRSSWIISSFPSLRLKSSTANERIYYITNNPRNNHWRFSYLFRLKYLINSLKMFLFVNKCNKDSYKWFIEYKEYINMAAFNFFLTIFTTYWLKSFSVPDISQILRVRCV